jgi:protein-disulfide isomerase
MLAYAIRPDSQVVNSQTDILPAIRAGLAAGEAIKVKGTPTVIINGWRLGTASSSMGLQKAIERILQGEQP